MIQGHKINQAEEERYLGLILKSGTYEEIIKANAQDKKMKAISCAQKIRVILKDPRIKRIGIAKATCLLIQGQLIPILLYGLKSFICMEERHYKMFEDSYKKALEIILEVPDSTNLESMLNYCNNFHLEQWIDALKLSYLNKKIHTKLCRKV